MDLKQLKKIAPAIDREIEAVFKKHGLNIRSRSANTNPATGELKWSFKLVDTNQKSPDGTATTPERENYKRLAEAYGLKLEWLGTTIRVNNADWIIAGLMPKRNKYPVLLVRKEDGKRSLFQVETICIYKSTQSLGGLSPVKEQVL